MCITIYLTIDSESSFFLSAAGSRGVCVRVLVRVCGCKCVCTAPITQMTTLTQLLFAICSTYLPTYTERNQAESNI